ncbi:unnamed protein product [Leuciscus chuanchicus]
MHPLVLRKREIENQRRRKEDETRGREGEWGEVGKDANRVLHLKTKGMANITPTGSTGSCRRKQREGTPEQVFSPSPESTIACQRGAVKALRGLLYGSRLVPVAFVSKLLKFCVLQQQPEWSVAIRGCLWPVVARWIRALQNNALSPTKHEENIKRPLTLASSACLLLGSSTAEEPPLGSPSGPIIHATQHPHTQTYLL